MAATEKINPKNYLEEANKNTQADVSDIMASISMLGRSSADTVREPVLHDRESVMSHAQAPDIQNSGAMYRRDEEPRNSVRTVAPNPAPRKPIETVAVPVDPKDDKPGYISLVIPNSLKKKWKQYCMNHDLSLTDCIKLAMDNLEQMELNDVIEIQGRFIKYKKQ